MKKLLLLLTFLPTLSWASWEDVIQQEENQAQKQQIKILNENFNLEKFKTQKDFEEFLVNKLYDKIIESCKYTPPIYRPLIEKDVMILGAQPKSIAVEESISANHISNPETSYSKTNIQKENVDEPEILKLNQNYIAYYNKDLGKILIIKSPVNNGQINLNQVNITDKIKVPSMIDKYSVKLFFVNNQLIAIGSRYSKALGQTVTDLVFYKIQNGKAKFQRLYDVKGHFKDARITNNKIYLITDYNFSRLNKTICEKYIYKPISKKVENVKKDFYDYNKYNYKTVNEKIKKLYKEQIDNLSKEQILKEIKKITSPSSIDIYIDKNKSYNINGKNYQIGIRLINSAYNNILFIPTDWDNVQPYNIHFNVVNIVDLSTGKNPNQYIIFGNISNGQIHMTTKSLYLVNSYYKSYAWKCPPSLRCFFPYFERGNFTLIHKFGLSGFDLNYVNSQIIPGRPINQYSMDEDATRDFRIFTKHLFPQRETDLYTFNPSLELVGQLTNIAPGEDFKSSKFLANKAFLVTFKATDPLFVIDLSNIKNPKIIGELKIPGYSLYLHPLWTNGNIQYLLGIGQEAKEVYDHRSLPKNIKIDLYKIDYSQKSGDYIHVEQADSLVLGKETKYKNGGSYTPVFDNPRTFVSLKSGNKNLIFLPVYLTEDSVQKKCYETYIWKDGKKQIQSQRCYDYTTKSPYFIGVKALQITLTGILQIPSLSKNLIKYYDQPVNQWQYKQENHRVGYYKANKLSVFGINSRFIDIYTKEKEKLLKY